MTKFKCIQGNAHGLKNRLEEFWNFLFQSSPSTVSLCETFWNSTNTIKFRQYHTIQKNRPNRPSGGVALLIHKSYQFKALDLQPFHTIEAVGINLLNTTHDQTDIVSAYYPKGEKRGEKAFLKIPTQRQ